MGFPTQLVALNPGMPNRESLAASVSPAWGFPRKSLNIEETLTDKETPNRGIEYLPSSGNLHAGFPAKVVTLNPGIWQVNFYYGHKRSTNVETTMSAFSTVSSQTRCAQKHCQHKDMNEMKKPPSEQRFSCNKIQQTSIHTEIAANDTTGNSPTGRLLQSCCFPFRQHTCSICRLAK